MKSKINITSQISSYADIQIGIDNCLFEAIKLIEKENYNSVLQNYIKISLLQILKPFNWLLSESLNCFTVVLQDITDKNDNQIKNHLWQIDGNNKNLIDYSSNEIYDLLIEILDVLRESISRRNKEVLEIKRESETDLSVIKLTSNCLFAMINMIDETKQLIKSITDNEK